MTELQILHPNVSRSTAGHCPADPNNRTREKFFQIWSHKAANLSNQLIEHTIRRLQGDRLQHLFQARYELTEEERLPPICHISMDIEDDLRRMKENVRQFCLMTRNVYRHLRSDSRLYPTMSIDLDQGITLKICRLIFKTKVLIKMFTTGKHQHEKQERKTTPDPYENIVKAFVVLQSNFEILFGDIVGRDFFENAKAAVQTLPIILDISKMIRLIFCSLYKFNEAGRKAEEEAMLQRRKALCAHRCSPKKTTYKSKSASMNNSSSTNKIVKEIFKTDQTSPAQSTSLTPTPTPTSAPAKLSITKSSQDAPRSSESRSKTKTNLSATTISTKQTQRKSATKELDKRKIKSSSSNTTRDKKPKNKNQTSSLSNSFESKQLLLNNNHFDETMLGWTTWIQNATRRLTEMMSLNLSTEPSNGILSHVEKNSNSIRNRSLVNISSQPQMITWASLDRLAKIPSA